VKELELEAMPLFSVSKKTTAGNKNASNKPHSARPGDNANLNDARLRSISAAVARVREEVGQYASRAPGLAARDAGLRQRLPAFQERVRGVREAAARLDRARTLPNMQELGRRYRGLKAEWVAHWLLVSAKQMFEELAEYERVPQLRRMAAEARALVFPAVINARAPGPLKDENLQHLMLLMEILKSEWSKYKVPAAPR
jgi:hypothetical protein